MIERVLNAKLWQLKNKMMLKSYNLISEAKRYQHRTISWQETLGRH
jgi:hypothetical protein